jgi:hypothetical protein
MGGISITNRLEVTTVADDQTTETPPAAAEPNEIGAVTKWIADHPVISLGTAVVGFMLYKGTPGFLTAKHNPRKKRRGKKS